MSRTLTRRLLAALCTLAFMLPRPAHAIIGIGIHYGLDFSLDMDDSRDETFDFGTLNLDLNAPGGVVPAGMPSVIPSEWLPVKLSRTGFTRTYFDLGGKILIDALRWFDIEVSTNLGLWEYEAQISYPTSITYRDPVNLAAVQGPDDLFLVTYSTLDLTCKELGLDYWFFDGTPYVKMHFDATVRKTFPKKFKTLKLYAGGGVSLHLATPVISAELIENVLEDHFATTLQTVQALGPDLFGNPDIMEAILEEVIAGLSEPKFGLNIVVGTQIKVPVIPLAFYVDGKLMIPFGQMDEYVDLNGFGFLVNGGVMLKF